MVKTRETCWQKTATFTQFRVFFPFYLRNVLPFSYLLLWKRNWCQFLFCPLIDSKFRCARASTTLWSCYDILSFNRRTERWKSWRPLTKSSDFFIVRWKHKRSDSVNKSLLWSSVDSLHQLEFAIWICVNTVQSRSACILNFIPQQFTGHHTNDTQWHQFRIWKVERKKRKVMVCLVI